jgi:hypothetical protein
VNVVNTYVLSTKVLFLKQEKDMKKLNKLYRISLYALLQPAPKTSGYDITSESSPSDL